MLIQRMLPTAPDPTKMWKMQRGTWLHECVGLSLSANEDWITEESDADACTFEGSIFGVEMSCRIDARKKNFTKVIDWKFRGDGAERWIDPMGRAKDEDSAQMNMARMLMEQTTGRDLTDMEMHVWVMSGQTVRTTVPWMSEDQIGAIRPGGGTYDVRSIFAFLEAGMTEWKKDLVMDDEARMRIIGALPMVGETMYRNKRTPSINMCSRYCEVSDTCFQCEGGI